MSSRFPGRLHGFLLGVAVLILVPLGGCGDSGDGKTVNVTPDFQKKTEKFLTDYQQKMLDQHKGKTATKKR
jgi:hypothetical protein